MIGQASHHGSTIGYIRDINRSKLKLGLHVGAKLGFVTTGRAPPTRLFRATKCNFPAFYTVRSRFGTFVRTDRPAASVSTIKSQAAHERTKHTLPKKDRPRGGRQDEFR